MVNVKFACGSMVALALGLGACADTATGTVTLSVRQIDVGSSGRSAVATFTPTTFRLPVTAVRLLGDNGEAVLYESPDDTDIEFIRSDGQPALTANQAAAVGTYHTLQFEIGRGDERNVVVGGCANLATEQLPSERHCTRADPSQSSLAGGPEPVSVRSANNIDSVLTEPIVVGEGGEVELNLYYDLTHAVSFLDEPGPSPNDPGFGRLGFGNGTSIEVKYPPIFAFIGAPPPVEIYEIELTTDPDPSVEPNLEASYYPLGSWRVRMWAFFDDAGDSLARRDVWVADEGADGPSLVSMFGNDAEMTPTGDGSYTISQPNPDPDFQSWRMPAFKRETHDGTAQWTTPDGNKDIGYTATRLN